MTAYSVVIPAFNTEAYIAEAILSVRAQTVPPREIVVVDDGSTDRTIAVVEGLGADIRLIKQENRGSGPATTVAIQAVTTALIATLDSDDIWLPHKMEQQLRLLQEMPDVAACFSRMRQFHHGEDKDAGGGPETDAWIRSSMVMRTEVAVGLGPMAFRGDAMNIVSGGMSPFQSDARPSGRNLGGSLSLLRRPRTSGARATVCTLAKPEAHA
jgi:glycosyltransferase involved in cell wall biosynthesis